MKLKAKILTIVLALAMLFSIVAVFAIPSSAATSNWKLRGDFNSWGEMAPTKTSGNYAIYDISLSANASYGFKIYNNNTWYGNGGTITDTTGNDWWGFGSDNGTNCTLKTTVAGKYIFVINTSTPSVAVYSPKTKVVGAAGLCGSGWNPADSSNAMSFVNGVFTKTYTNVPEGTYEYKVSLVDDWSSSFGNNGGSDNASVTVGSDNCTVTIKFDVTTRKPSAVVVNTHTDSGTDGDHNCDVCNKENVTSCSGGIATCTTKAACEDCGQSYGSVNASNHTGSESVKNGTANVHSTYSCCGATFSETHNAFGDWTKVDNTNHSRTCSCGYVESEAHTVGTAATCTAAAVCGTCKSNYGSVNASNHTGEIVNGGTAEKHTKYDCCEAVVSSTHNMNQWHVDGDKHYKKCECGYYDLATEAIHTYTNWTDLENGQHKGTCTCGATTTEAHNYTDAYDADCNNCGATRTVGCRHANKSDLVPEESATCTKTGRAAYYYCTDCNAAYWNEQGTEVEYDALVIEKKSHSYTGSYVCLTDGKAGTHAQLCVNGCNNPDPNPSAHTWNSGVQTTDPKCGVEGVKTFTCTAGSCGATYTESVTALDHIDENTDHECDRNCGKTDMGDHEDSEDDEDHICDYCKDAEDILEACFDVTGDEDHDCDICGAENVTDHSYTDATCTAPKTCSECGATDGEALAHTYNKKVTDEKYLKSSATCQSAAVYYKSCSCGASSKGTENEETFTSGSKANHVFTETGCQWCELKTLYLLPNSNWLQGNARFVGYFFLDKGNNKVEEWVDMNDNDVDGYYSVTIPEGEWTGFIFVRMNPGTTENNWDNKWNQTKDLSFEDGKDCYTCPQGDDYWDEFNGTWSVYSYVDPIISVAGAADLCNGIDWTPGHESNKMTLVDGIYTIVYYGVPAGNYNYKIVRGTGWGHGEWSNGSAGGTDNNSKVVVPANCCTVTITFNPITKEVAATTSTAHNYGEGDWIDEIPKTCTTDGTLGHFYCDVCSKNYDENGNELASLVILAGHEYGELTKQDATCIADGLLEHYFCDDCDTYFTSEKVETTAEALKDTKTGHDFSNGVTAQQDPTCLADGRIAYVYCPNCKLYFKDSVLEEDDNGKYVTGGSAKSVFDSTTEAGGFVIAQLGHDYSGDYVNNGDGTHSQLCVNGCGDPNPTTIGHVYDKEVVEDTYKVSDATCTAKAVYNKSCACGAKGSETFSAGEKNANNHTGEEVKGGTATVHSKWSCCDVTISSTHSYGDWTPVADTNTHKHTCSCGYFETEDHSFANYVYNDDATCTADGTETGSCVCGATHTQTDADSKLGHSFGEVVEKVDETCTEAGRAAYVHCSECKKYFFDSVLDKENGGKYEESGVYEPAFESTFRIPAAGHNYGEWITQVDAKCTTDGTLGHYTCDKCGKNFDADKKELDSLVITAPGHAWANPTCTESSTCTECGATSGEPMGHKFTTNITCDNNCGTKAAAQVGENYYLTVAKALEAAKAAGIQDLVITVVGENDASTADNFDLVYESIFDSVIFKQENGDKTYYFDGLYTGKRTNDGEFTFDGVNIVVTGQYMFEGNVRLANNSFIKSVTEANCFFYYSVTTVEPGSKLNGVIDDLRGGTLIIDGGRTDGEYNATPDMQDAIIVIRWSGDSLTVKNGAYVKINSANEIGRLTVSAGTSLNVYDSKVDSYQWIDNNGTINVDVNSVITTGKITGAGKIIIDAAEFEAGDAPVVANVSEFTGEIEVINNDDLVAFVDQNGNIVLMNAIAKIGETYYDNIQTAVNAGGEIVLLKDVTLTETLTVGTTVSIDTGSYTLTSTAANAILINAAEVEFELSGKFKLEDPAIAAYARSGDVAVAQTVLTVGDYDNVKAILSATFDIGAEDVIYSGEVDNITLKVLDDYVTHLAQYGYITGESDGTYVQVIGKSEYYIGANGNWYISGIDTGVKAEGVTISSYDKQPVKNGEYIVSYDYVINFSDGSTVTINVPVAVSISKIEKTSTEGLVDTYTITYTDGTTTTFTVTNGAQGIQGIQGEKGEDGHTPVITIVDGYWAIDGVKTSQLAQGVKGDTGNGISDISKTGTVGLVDTYTITYTDGTTTTFTVTNGADGHSPVITIVNGEWHIDGNSTGVKALGKDGKDGKGIKAINKTTDGLVDTYTIIYTDDTEFTFTVTNGRGIVSITLTSTSADGLVDTYTITYNDGSTSTFTVTNGEKGVQGIKGDKGDDGHTPVITIQNGKWHVDGNDTGLQAQGVKGETGNGISDISKTNVNGLVDTYTITYTDGTKTTFTVTNGAQGVQGIQGIPGKDGKTPVITIIGGNWHIDGVDTGVKAEGLKGDKGDKGDDGDTPYIGPNGNWWVGDTDTGFHATGDDGHTPDITIGENGNWFIDGVDTGVKAEGKDGNDNNKIIIICIGIAALCIMTTIVAVSTKRFRRPWWILC